MKKIILSFCLTVLALGVQAQSSNGDPVTLDALNAYYSCKKTGENGGLQFWVAGKQLVVEENWSDSEGYGGGTAYLCEIRDRRLTAVKSCEVEMAQWDGIVVNGIARWEDVKDYFEPVKPFVITYNAKARSFTIQRNVFKYAGKAEDGPNFNKVEAVASQLTVVEAGADDDIYEIVENMPEFPGGPSGVMAYLRRSIQYPAEAQESYITGSVRVSFVVEKDGSVSNVKVIKSVHELLDREAVRVVKAMPKWQPGMQNGKPVRTRYNLPVTFRLN